VLVGVGDDEAMSVALNDRTDVEINGSVVVGSVDGRLGFHDAHGLQELAADEARVAHGRLVDGELVVGEAVL